ncbi:MAG: peptidoglycan editing factor PgeF [Desulfomonile tiedjei]|nr:peptidoglycan editing factor PgeF [Desulfomonile tiedjei]
MNIDVSLSKVQENQIALAVSAAESFGAVMAFSLRQGGQSPEPFDSLNFSASQGDSQENVRSNFAILGKHIGIDPQRIVTCRQVHGDHIQMVDAPLDMPSQADAIVTATPDIFPAVKTADCVPILILDPVRKIAAAVHAGWRGTILRITRKTLEFMGATFHSDPSQLLVGIGPGIGPCCYEVDDAVLKPFRKSFPDAERFISEHNSSPRSTTSYHLDLSAANRFELTEMGVPQKNIHVADLCTACHKDLFFSHRRDGANSGRHIAVVGFRG